MKKQADRLTWVFGCGGDDVSQSRLVRFWRQCACDVNVVSWLVVRMTTNNRRFLSSLDDGVRKHVIFHGSRRHQSVVLQADLFLAEKSQVEVLPEKFRKPLIALPLVVFPPDDGAAPSWGAGYAENSLLRYVVSDCAHYRYLMLAEGFRPYQLFFDEDLGDVSEVRWNLAAKRLRENLYCAQTNSFVFLGFALTHIGGTPMATHALAEGLLERGFQVSYVCLRETAIVSTPFGIPITSVEGVSEVLNRNSRLRRLARGLIPKCVKLRALRYDPGVFSPECGMQLRAILKCIRCKTLISTRDSLHEFLSETDAVDEQNKVYFFHCSSRVWRSLFGDAIERIRRIRIRKAIFVTESNRLALIRDFGFRSYDDFLVLGNGLPSSRMIEREQIQLPIRRKRLRVCFPTRLEPERREGIESLFAFAEFLMQENVQDILIDVYGQGSDAMGFQEEIKRRGVQEIIVYGGVSTDMCRQYAEHDAVVDFTRVQSFGMVYIESILNGRMVFCYRNEGSSEVLREIPDAYFETDQELLMKLRGVRTMTLEKVRQNYDLIAKRFSRQAVSRRFVEFLEK